MNEIRLTFCILLFAIQCAAIARSCGYCIDPIFTTDLVRDEFPHLVPHNAPINQGEPDWKCSTKTFLYLIDCDTACLQVKFVPEPLSNTRFRRTDKYHQIEKKKDVPFLEGNITIERHYLIVMLVFGFILLTFILCCSWLVMRRCMQSKMSHSVSHPNEPRGTQMTEMSESVVYF